MTPSRRKAAARSTSTRNGWFIGFTRDESEAKRLKSKVEGDTSLPPPLNGNVRRGNAVYYANRGTMPPTSERTSSLSQVGERIRAAGGPRGRGRERAFLFYGAAQESNLPSRGLHDRTGFEDRLGHRAHAAPYGSIVAPRLRTRSSPTRRVMPSASKRSSRSWAGRREMPSRSRKRASVIMPARSHSSIRARLASS